MNKLIIGIGITVFVLFFLGVGMFIGSGESTSSEKIGSQLVYNGIDATTNCQELQEGFDIAMDNVEWRQPGDNLRDISLSYAEYTNKRMEKVGCYN